LISGLWKKKWEEGRSLPEAIFQHPVRLGCDGMQHKLISRKSEKRRLAGPKGESMVAAADYFTLPRQSLRMENVLAPDELLTQRDPACAWRSEERALRSPLQGIARLAYLLRHRAPDDEWCKRTVGSCRDGRGCADSVAVACSRAGTRRQANQ
jgi:hypothetical protein